MHYTHKTQNNRGLTLVEILIATLIGALALGGVMESFHVFNILSRNARQTSMAVNHAQNLMERISATGFTDITTDFPDGVVDGGGTYQAIVGGYTLDSEQMTVTYTNVTTDPLEIIVTVNWQGPQSRNLSTNLSTYRTE